MENQKIMELFDNITNRPSKFRTRNWVEVNDESRGKYDSSIIRFKTPMIRSNYIIILTHTHLLAEL